jgi:hypothetical protein
VPFRHQLAPVYFLVAIFLLNFIARIIFSPGALGQGDRRA